MTWSASVAGELMERTKRVHFKGARLSAANVIVDRLPAVPSATVYPWSFLLAGTSPLPTKETVLQPNDGLTRAYHAFYAQDLDDVYAQKRQMQEWIRVNIAIVVKPSSEQHSRPSTLTRSSGFHSLSVGSPDLRKTPSTSQPASWLPLLPQVRERGGG